MSFGKFFASCFTGSMLGAGPDVFAVWAYCIANAAFAQVELNPKLLALSIGMSIERVNAAIDFLCAPDPASRNKDHDGRRLIKEGEFAYLVVSHDIYRAIRDEEGRRKYMRNYMKNRRAEERKHSVSSGKQRKPKLAQAEAEAEAEERGKTSPPPPPDPIFGKDPEPTPITAAKKRVPVSDVDRISHAGGITKREDLGGWQLLVDDHGLEKVIATVQQIITSSQKAWLSTVQKTLSGNTNGSDRLPAGLPTHITVRDPAEYR